MAERGHIDQSDISEDDLAPPPLSLLDDPMGFIDAEHARQRTVCRALSRLAVEPHMPRRLADGIVAALSRDRLMHHQDEDEDLFPLLRQRALPEDMLVPMLAQLARDHTTSAASVRKISEALSSTSGGTSVPVDRRTAGVARDYAMKELRHLAIENSIVMVIARRRLKAEDLLALSRSMKLRRGAAV